MKLVPSYSHTAGGHPTTTNKTKSIAHSVYESYTYGIYNNNESHKTGTFPAFHELNTFYPENVYGVLLTVVYYSDDVCIHFVRDSH